MKVFDTVAGGSVIAQFTGTEAQVVLSALPNEAFARARVVAGDPRGGFQVRGFVDPDAVPLFTKRRVPIASGHLWIAEGVEVQFAAAQGRRVRVTKDLKHPVHQQFSAWGDCDDFSLEAVKWQPWQVPGGARGYVAKTLLELFDKPSRGSNVGTLRAQRAGGGMLLWSVDQRGPMVHVRYHGEIIVDAWARRGALRALPPGETMDTPPPPLYRSHAKLEPAGKRRVAKARGRAEIRLRPGGSGKVVGSIEPGTELFVLDRVAGYLSVLPKPMSLAPEADFQFWVDERQLSGAPRAAPPPADRKRKPKKIDDDSDLEVL